MAVVCAGHNDGYHFPLHPAETGPARRKMFVEIIMVFKVFRIETMYLEDVVNALERIDEFLIKGFKLTPSVVLFYNFNLVHFFTLAFGLRVRVP